MCWRNSRSTRPGTIVAQDGDLELKDVRDNVAHIRYRAARASPIARNA